MRRVVFRGWWVVFAAVVGQCFSLGTLLVFTFGVFAKPLASEFHATRGAIALAVSLLDLVVTLSAASAGRLVDRWGARRVILPSILALAACLVALGFVRLPLWHLYALYALAGLVGVASSPISYSRVVANWFNRRRGLALGIAGTGIGLGAFVVPSFAQLLIDERGWRAAYLGLAVVSVGIALPLVVLFLRGRPADHGLQPDGAPVPRDGDRAALMDGMTLLEALRTRVFWQLFGVFFCVAACVNGTFAHLVPLLTDRGVAGRDAALAISVFGAASIVGKLANGHLIDRFFAPRVAAVSFTGAAVGLVILLSGATGAAPFVAAALLGVAIGAETDIMPFLVSRYFGMRSMAALFGCVFGSYTLGNGAGRYLYAAGFDATGSYRVPLEFALGGLLLAIVGTSALEKYP